MCPTIFSGLQAEKAKWFKQMSQSFSPLRPGVYWSWKLLTTKKVWNSKTAQRIRYMIQILGFRVLHPISSAYIYLKRFIELRQPAIQRYFLTSEVFQDALICESDLWTTQFSAVLSLIQAPCSVTSANVKLEEDHGEDTETCGGERSHATNSIMTCPHSWPFLEEEQVAMKPLQDERARQTTETSGAKHLAVTCKQSRSQGRQNDQSEEEEASEGPEQHESEAPCISDKSLRETKPQKNVHRLLGVRHKYTFQQSVENLHMGRPAFSSGDLNPCERPKCLKRVVLVRVVLDSPWVQPSGRVQFKTERETLSGVTVVVRGRQVHLNCHTEVGLRVLTADSADLNKCFFKHFICCD